MAMCVCVEVLVCGCVYVERRFCVFRDWVWEVLSDRGCTWRCVCVYIGRGGGLCENKDVVYVYMFVCVETGICRCLPLQRDWHLCVERLVYVQRERQFECLEGAMWGVGLCVCVWRVCAVCLYVETGVCVHVFVHV